jgi:hypothetical protein
MRVAWAERVFTIRGRLPAWRHTFVAFWSYAIDQVREAVCRVVSVETWQPRLDSILCAIRSIVAVSVLDFLEEGGRVWY